MLNKVKLGWLLTGLALFTLATASYFSPTLPWLIALAVGCGAIGLKFLWHDIEELHQLSSNDQVKASFEQLNDHAQAQIALIGHEVRTPLNGIMGTLEVIKNSDDPQDIKYMAERAIQASENLLLVLNNNIDAVKFEQGQFTLNAQPHSLLTTCENVILLHSHLASSKDIALNFHFDPRLFSTIFLYDDTRLSQVMNNLVGNALKFTRQGHVSLWVSQIKSTDDIVSIRITVEDSGPGIEKQDVTRIKDKFYRTQQHSHRSDGAGLGLFIGQQILSLMGSNLDISSKPGFGSSFYFDLSLKVAMRDPMPHCALPISVSILAPRSHNIELLNTYLQQWGFIVHCLSEWDDVLFQLNKQILIVDHTLAEFYHTQMQQLAFNRPKESIIVLVPSSSKTSREQVWPSFHAQLLRKPILPSELKRVLFEQRAETLSTSDNSARAATDLSHLRVLCVDDVKVNQMVFKAQLNKLGVQQVSLADNGQHALQLASKFPLDIIMMDINMPILDGIQATKILRNRGFKGPIIGITALTEE
ncbi:MAG: hypothetical protein RL336_1102, partial [Pseudomonadota bacterium]